MPLVGGPDVRSIQQCGEADRPLHSYFGRGGEVPVPKDFGAEPTKGSRGQADADLYTIVNVAGGRRDAAEVVQVWNCDKGVTVNWRSLAHCIEESILE